MVKDKKIPLNLINGILSYTFGRKTGLEPATFGTTIRRSNQLSYNLRFRATKV